jgi:hypothetical protein
VKICGVNRETTTHTLAQCQNRRCEDVFSVAIAIIQHLQEWQEARILCGRQRLPISWFVFFTIGIVTGSDVGHVIPVEAFHVQKLTHASDVQVISRLHTTAVPMHTARI